MELFGKTGKRRDLMRTQQCQYNSQNGDLFSSGPVHIELNSEAENTRAAGSKGSRTVYLETSKVSYQHEKSLVTSDEVVHFRVGAASGIIPGDGLRHERWFVGSRERRGHGITTPRGSCLGSSPGAYRQPPSL